MRREIDTIRQHLRRSELLAQLAEECAELGHAALKLRRAIDTANPTPIPARTAEKNLREEIADVLLLMQICTWDDVAVLDIRVGDEIMQTIQRKLERWVDRLNERGEAQCAGSVGSSPSGGSGVPSAGRR